MAYPLYALAAEHPGSALYALSLLVGALPDALAPLFQRRGLGRRGGFRTRRRRRSGGLLGALGALALVFVGPLVLLALAAYAVYRFVGGRRGR